MQVRIYAIEILRDLFHYREKAKGSGQRRIALYNAFSESSTESDLLSALKDNFLFHQLVLLPVFTTYHPSPTNPPRAVLKLVRQVAVAHVHVLPNTRASIHHAQNIAARQSDAASNKAIRALRNAASFKQKRQPPLLRMNLLRGMLFYSHRRLRIPIS